MYRIYTHVEKILHLDEGDFRILVKMVYFKINCMAHFRELPEDEGGITCMLKILGCSSGFRAIDDLPSAH